MWPNAKERLHTFSHYGNDQNHKMAIILNQVMILTTGKERGGGGVGHSTVVKRAVLNMLTLLHISPYVVRLRKME